MIEMENQLSVDQIKIERAKHGINAALEGLEIMAQTAAMKQIENILIEARGELEQVKLSTQVKLIEDLRKARDAIIACNI